MMLRSDMDTRAPLLQAVVHIDPTFMNQEQKQYLTTFLKKALENKSYLLLANTEYDLLLNHVVVMTPPPKQSYYFYPFSSANSATPNTTSIQNPLPKKITLKYKLIYRECSSDLTKHHFDVYSGKVLGGVKQKNGAFGNIEELLGTLTLTEENQLTYKPTKTLVSKVQNENPIISKTEEEISKRVPYLRAKSVTHYQFPFEPGLFKPQTAMVMHLMPGKDLEYYIEYDRKAFKLNRQFLATDQRISMCIAIILSFMHVHELKINHADIKPGNVMIKILMKGVYAYSIDFGFSIDANEKMPDRRGTAMYMAPEVIEFTSNTQKSDIYSLGWVLALIMRADKNDCTYMSEAVYFANHCKFTNLFNGIDDLSKDHQKIISLGLHQMVVPNPLERFSLHEMLAIFERVELERQLKVLDKSLDQRAFKIAFEYGVSLRQSLRKLSEEECEFHSQLEIIETLFISTFQMFAQNEKFFDACLYRLGLYELHEVSGVNAAELRVKTIINDYRVYYQKLLSFSELVKQQLSKEPCPAKESLEILQNHLNKAIAQNKGILTLDVLGRLSKHYKKMAEATEKQLAYFKRLHAKKDDFSIFVYDNYIEKNKGHCFIIEEYDQAMRTQPDIKQIALASETATYRW